AGAGRPVRSPLSDRILKNRTLPLSATAVPVLVHTVVLEYKNRPVSLSDIFSMRPPGAPDPVFPYFPPGFPYRSDSARLHFVLLKKRRHEPAHVSQITALISRLPRSSDICHPRCPTEGLSDNRKASGSVPRY